MLENKPAIICFGEVLWDCYPDKQLLGGAPLNVAAHLIKLGSAASIISKVGIDNLGERLIQQIHAIGLAPDYIQKNDQLPTGQVLVQLKEGLPSYEIMQPVAWDSISANVTNRILVTDSSALVYGTLACRSKESRAALFQLIPLSSFNICDLNIRKDFYSKELISTLLDKTHLLKINDDEAELLATMYDLDSSNFYTELSQLFNLEMIIKTLGGDGSEVYAEGKIYRQVASKVKVVDTVGSGDAFLAGFIHSYLNARTIQAALELASFMGGFVASQSGAIPDYNINSIRPRG